MSDKELRKQLSKIVKSGLKKIVMSEEFSQSLSISKQISNNSLILKLIIFTLGFVFAPRLTLIYSAYIFIKPIVKLASFIREVEEEEGISIIK